MLALNKTVADINIDELIPYGRTRDMAIIGFGQSQMDDYLRDALAAQQRTITPDDKPEQGFFYRSDQLNFARKGVPVLYARDGFDKLDGGKSAGRAAYDEFTRNRYHKPTDEYDPRIVDLSWHDGGRQRALRRGKASALADESTFPKWAADSEFRDARETSSGAAQRH